MKKMYALLCSMILAVALFAAPENKLLSLEQASATAMHPAVQRALTHDMSKKALPAAQKQVKKAPAHRLAPITKAEAQTIVLNGEGFLVGPEYEAATGEWYVALEAGGYTFRLCWYGDEDNYCGTYAFDDISMEYSWGLYQSAV